MGGLANTLSQGTIAVISRVCCVTEKKIISHFTTPNDLIFI